MGRYLPNFKYFFQEIINDHIKTSPIVDLFPIVKSEQQKIIETHPLHPMCKWYPPSHHSVVGNDLFVNFVLNWINWMI